jgi:hypothetical protein
VVVDEVDGSVVVSLVPLVVDDHDVVDPVEVDGSVVVVVVLVPLVVDDHEVEDPV